MKIRSLSIFLILLLLTPDVMGFCGFYVAKASSDLFNRKSEVILVRDGNRTVITMSNDFEGNVNDFAMVVPVPVVLQKDQIKVVDRGIFDRLDAYSAPRLVEYHDPNPCYDRLYLMENASMSFEDSERVQFDKKVKAEAVGVTIEASYTIGEYDILLLSAKESIGLETWLRENGYQIPDKAASILKPYILSNTKFFVVKVNLEEKKRHGFDNLRPIQISFESDRFMLPIRLGMANADGAQDLIVYAFTREGRVEPVNYRTAKIPSNRNVPLFVERYFGDFYKDLFERAYNREGRKAVFLEYAWNVSPNFGVKCDPCVSPPPVFNDFREAGVNWISGMNSNSDVFFTRLHVRYTRNQFPEDLRFQVTPNREHFQARYVLTHPAEGDLTCEEGKNYRQELTQRRKLEVEELAILAGWTNPNYTDYINEYALEVRDDKYAPQKNEFLPIIPSDPGDDSGDWGKYALLGFALLGIMAFSVSNRIKMRTSTQQ